MKKTILSLMLFFAIGNSIAQNTFEEELQKKYFTSRNRLKKWFVTANGAPGGGYPIENIRLFQGMYNYPFKHVILKADGTDSAVSDYDWDNINGDLNRKNTEISGNISGDNPIIMIGEYLQVLSTEYWLLQYYKKENTEEFTAVKNEIYYALMALDRLDGSAEKYFNPTQNSLNYNGFLRRDDTDFDKLKRVNDYFGYFDYLRGNIQAIDFNNVEGVVPDTSFLGDIDTTYTIKKIPYKDTMIIDTITINGTFISDTFFVVLYKDTTISNIASLHKYYRKGYQLLENYTAHPERLDKWPNMCAGRLENEISLDELIGALVGLRYVQKYVDDGATAKPWVTDSLKNLVGWTREIANRLMLHLTKTTYNIPALDPSEMDDPDNITNGILFTSGNYVLTNPAANDRIVKRGPYGYAFGYPLEQLGEKLASSATVTKDYPSTSLKFSKTAKKIIKSVHGNGRHIGMNVIGSLVAGFYWIGDEVFRSDKATGDNIYLEITGRCGTLNWYGLDAASLCLIGEPLSPEKPIYWEKLWNHLGDSNDIVGKMYRKYGKNAGSASVMAAKLAAMSGTWEQGDFDNFAEYCGFPMMTLQYDMMNDKAPIRSKAYFQNLLSSMDCLGTKGNGWPFDRDVLGGAAMRPEIRNNTYTDSGFFNAPTGFELYYNLYRIAEIKYWGNSIPNYDDNGCPCFIEGFEQNKKIPFSALEPKRVVSAAIGANGSSRDSVSHSYKTKYIQVENLVKTKDANPSHLKVGIRQHEYLNHHYELGSNQTFEVIRDLVVCNSDLLIKSGGKVLLDTPANQLSPNEILVRKNSLIKINNNGQLYVQNGSRVIIEQGASLIYNQGARIILNGPNAVLHIKGGLVLGQNATFKIEGGPAGKGYVIWENNWIENPPNYNNSVSINPGAVIGSNYGASAGIVANSSNTILFTNPSGPFNGAGNLALKCLGNLGLMTTWGLGKLEIKECKVELGPESRIVSEAGNTAITNVDVNGYMGPSLNTKYDWKYTSMGVHVLGRKNDLSHVKFTNCYLGLKIFNVGTHEPLNLTDVNFHNCIKAIQNDAGRIIYNGGEINGQAGLQRYAGIEGIGTQGRSDLNYVNVVVPNYQWLLPSNKRFAKGEYCAGLKSHGTAEYYLLKSSISQADKGIELDQSFARPVCSILDNNGVAVSAIQNSKFNITNNTHNTISYANNSPSSPRYFLRGYQNVYLYLDAASNAISGSNYNSNFIDITVSKLQNLSGSNGTTSFHPLNTPGIAASGNQWNIWNGNESDIWNTSYPYPTPTNENVSIIGTYLGNVSGLDLLTRPTINQSTFDADKATNCPIYEANKGWKLLGPPPSNWANEPVDPFLGVNIVQRSVGFIPYRRSLYSAGGNMNWLGFLNECKTILDTIIPDTLGMAMHDIYTGVHSSYKDLFIDTTIPPANKPTVELATYNLLTTMQQNLITRSSDMDNAYRFMRFELHRDLALIHRAFNHRNDGISHINSVINTFTNPKDQEALLAWKCILEREQMYLDTLIAYDSVFLYTCVPNYYNDDSTHNFVHFGFEPWLYNGGGEENYNYAPNPSGLNPPPATKKQPITSILTIFPNPAENSYTIVCNEAMFNIRVTDNTGRVIQTLKANGQKSLQIDASNYSRGIYFVEAYGTDKRFVQRLLINK